MFFWTGADSECCHHLHTEEARLFFTVVMILRLYAMYNRSRVILVVLLVLYTVQCVVFFIATAMYSFPTYGIGTDRVKPLIHAIFDKTSPRSDNYANIQSHAL